MKKKYIEDLKEIKDIMNRSSRFISLSGISGVSTGIIAIAGTFLAYQNIFKGQDFLIYDSVAIRTEQLSHLLMIAAGTLILSAIAAVFFTTRKTRKQNQPLWDHQSKRLLLNLSIPLITGGVLCLMLLAKGFVGLLPPLTLIFYGLALVNGSKYTLHEIRTLGLIEIVLGLIALQYIEYGLIIWALGFGILHVVYGIIIQSKYKS
jgi:hypothetical protein